MKLFKYFSFLRFYIAICMLALSAFCYAEYYGYELLGSDENGRIVNGHATGSYGGSYGSSGAHHK